MIINGSFNHKYIYGYCFVSVAGERRHSSFGKRIRKRRVMRLFLNFLTNTKAKGL